MCRHVKLPRFRYGWIKVVINLPRPKGSDLLLEFSDFRIGPGVNNLFKITHDIVTQALGNRNLPITIPVVFRIDSHLLVDNSLKTTGKFNHTDTSIGVIVNLETLLST